MRHKVKYLVLVLLVAVGFSGCISKAEYREFINSTDEFVNHVGDDYIARLKSDRSVNPQTIINRQKDVQRMKDAVEAAKKRTE